ncbi:hypothetical protein L7F22_003340 [Adiantum nelumboides]|nr:hypothetical protein [Adiantum nelumboides]
MAERLLARLFNRALVEGLPDEWTMHTIVPIHESGDTLDPGNYRTIMIGHTLAKLYGAVLEAELSTHAEVAGIRAPGQVGFRRTFSTIDHIFVLRCLIDGAKAQKRRLYCCFVDFRKAFDTIPRERLFQRLQELQIPSEMIWGIHSLYTRVSGRVHSPGGLSDPIASTIGVKQGCPLSLTLFGLYIDEISDYILLAGGARPDLAGTPVHIMLYADDIILLSETQEGLECHLRTLDDFCIHRGLTVNLGKTKVMIFHTSVFTAVGGQVEVVDSYVYLGVTFKGTTGRFSMAEAARDRFMRGYAALAMLERRCHQAHFQESRTKGWLFDTLVTPAMMYGAVIWAPGKVVYIQRTLPLVRWAEVASVARITTTNVSKFVLNYICSRFGTPLEILSDRGPGFRADLLDALLENLSIKHVHSTPYYPQCNGLVEKTNGVLCKIITKHVRDRPQDWDKHLTAALWAYRTSFKVSTQFTPYHLVYGQEALLPIEVELGSLRVLAKETSSSKEKLEQRILDLQQLELDREAATDYYITQANKKREQFNNKIKEKKLEEGMLVMRYDSKLDLLHSKKFLQRWKGPYVIFKKFKNGSYQLQDLSGNIHKYPVNGWRLKEFFQRIQPIKEERQVSLDA